MAPVPRVLGEAVSVVRDFSEGFSSSPSYTHFIALAGIIITLIAVLVLSQRIIKYRRLRRQTQNSRRTYPVNDGLKNRSSNAYDMRSWYSSSVSSVESGSTVDSAVTTSTSEVNYPLPMPHASLSSRVLSLLCLPADASRNSSGATCAICLHGSRHGKWTSGFGCEHSFHVECLRSFLCKSTANHCPLCARSSRQGRKQQRESS